MHTIMDENNSLTKVTVNHITDEDVKRIVEKYPISESDVVESYNVYNASDKMLGFLGDYWKLRVNVMSKTGDRRVLSFFVKAVSRSNPAKAEMVVNLYLYQAESSFYSLLKSAIELPDLKPWSPRMVTTIENAMVFEDLSVINYRLQDKFARFDVHHTQQALSTLARFHASSFIYEEKRSEVMKQPHRISDEFSTLLEDRGYTPNNTWFRQCMIGALEAVKTFSKYKHHIATIEKSWSDVWAKAVTLDVAETKYRNVISHRDLWNNNLLFHYTDVDGDLVPDDCVLIDFQAMKIQPPAADVMLLLHCNQDRSYREKHLNDFLEYYYLELKKCLDKYEVDIEKVLPKDVFLESVQIQKQWALIACACLLPQIWIDADLMADIFGDTERFDEILSKDKATFIKKFIMNNDDYKTKVMEVFDEIVERYCLNGKKVS